jgi:hypothetical protein
VHAAALVGKHNCVGADGGVRVLHTRSVLVQKHLEHCPALEMEHTGANLHEDIILWWKKLWLKKMMEVDIRF